MDLHLRPVAFVRSTRTAPEDDFWGGTESILELTPELTEEALLELETFSHAEIVYFFHLVPDEKIVSGARHPRNNPEWPRAGIFAQRGKNRPNRLGTSLVRILGREGTRLRVAELDAIDGTPVLDIKPVWRGMLPREPVTEPAWATELMRDYFSRR